MNHANFQVTATDSVTLTVYVAWPDSVPPRGGWPMSLVFDEKEFWVAVQSNVANSKPCRHQLKGVVVGIALPERQCRHRYYTPALSTRYASHSVQPVGTGYSHELEHCLMHVVLPAIERLLPINFSYTTVGGHSLGALFVAQLLFSEPTRFTRYVLSSPSVWWGNFYLLEQARYWNCLPKGHARPEVLVSVGEYEQGLTPADLLLPLVRQQENRQRREQRRMVAGAQQFAETLGESRCFDVKFTVIEQADHGNASRTAFRQLFIS